MNSPSVAAVGAAALCVCALALANPPRIDVERRVDTGAMPKGASVSPDGTRLYVTNYGQLNRNNIGIFDTATLRRVGTVDLPGIAVESAVSPDGRTLYVSNFRRNSVQFVDLGSRQVTAEVTVGSHPKILVLSRDGRRLFAANWSGESVSEIEVASRRVVRTLRAGANPRGMALTRAGTLYVANFNDHSIDVYQGADLSRHHTIRHVCRVPRHLSLSPDDRTLYISCFTGSFLAAMDTTTERIAHTVSVGRSPKATDVLPGGRYVVTADYGGSGASIVDTQDWTARTLDIPGMDHASGVAAARQGMRFFVTGWYDDHVYAVAPFAHGASPFTITPVERSRVHEQRAYHDQHPAE